MSELIGPAYNPTQACVNRQAFHIDAAEAIRIADYYNARREAAISGREIPETIVLDMGTLGILSAPKNGISEHVTGMEDLSTGHTVSGTLFTSEGDVYHAEATLHRRSIMARLLGRPVRGYVSLWDIQQDR